MKNLQKELVIVLDMQHIYCSGSDWTENGHMFLHQGANMLVNSVEIARNEPRLQILVI